MLHRQITSGGVDKLDQEGFKMRGVADFEGLPRRALKIFFLGCHYSFNAAQKQIAGLMIEIIGEKRALEETIKAARIAKDANQVNQLTARLRQLDRQGILLRRLLDCVLSHFIGSQTWILRRLMVYREIRDIDVDVLEKTVAEADRRNREDRMMFHLVTDLLTAVHVGDLIKVDRSDFTKQMQPGEWEVIELKSGKVNDTLGKVLERQREESVSASDLDQVKAQLGPKGVKQVERMLRQRIRQERVETLIRTDEGLEPISGKPMRLVDPGEDYEDYFHIIRLICDQLATEPLASGVYQECFCLIGITRQALERFEMSGIVHQFFHMRNPERQCMLNGKGDIESANHELKHMSELSGVIDLVDANLRSGWSLSIFNWPMNEETRFKLAFGDYRIFLSINYEHLFQMAAREKDIMIEWIPSDLKGVKGETRDFLVSHSDIIAGSPDARGAQARRRDEPTFTMMSGFFNRMFVELMTPKYWLDLLEKTADGSVHGPRSSPSKKAGSSAALKVF
jgi:hypothetical protein